jgi:4-amino-4-deoxy-L-arabinose transferase-like glycosyltransferase
MTRILGAPVYRWLGVGIGMLGVTGSVVYVTKETQPWLSAGTLLVAMVVLAISLVMVDGKAIQPSMDRRMAGDVPAPRWLLLLALMAIAITAATADNFATQTATFGAVAHRWLISIGLLLLIGWWHPLVRTVRGARNMRWSSVTFPSFRTWGPWLGIIAFAAIPRLVLLNRYPTVVGGDEGNFMLIARTSQEGSTVNPFGTGFFSTPNLYLVAQGWLAGVVGQDVAGYRLLSVVVGVIGVVATWRLGRYLIGPRPAAIGAIILATMPFHVFWSRVALNNVADPTTIVLALLFLVRSVTFGHRSNAILCGMVLGIGFYGYYGGRAIPIVVLLLLPILAASRRIGVQRTIRTGAWINLGFLAVAMPLITYYINNPAPFAGHLNQVEAISLDRLRQEPGTVIALYVDNVWDALMLPWIGNDYFFFRHDAPFLGWPVAILLALGVGVWIARFFLSRDIGRIASLLLPWIALAAGVALTTPVGGHRLLVITPFWALATGTGLFAVARWLALAWPSMAGPVFRTVIVAALLVMSVNHVRWSATEERQHTYSENRTTLAWDMGWRLSRHDPDFATMPMVLFAGPPMMFSDGWGNLRFLAPDLEIADVEASFTDTSTGPDLADNTVLVLIGERGEERCAAERLYADATVAEVRAFDGALLYVMFFHEPLPGWSSATTPAGTTFTAVTESRCDA